MEVLLSFAMPLPQIQTYLTLVKIVFWLILQDILLLVEKLPGYRKKIKQFQKAEERVDSEHYTYIYS